MFDSARRGDLACDPLEYASMNPRHKDQVGGFFKKVMAQGVSAKSHADPVQYALNRWGVD